MRQARALAGCPILLKPERRYMTSQLSGLAPALMVAPVILFMGLVSGAHLDPATSVAFTLRGAFPWQRVPAHIVTQFVGATGIGR